MVKSEKVLLRPFYFPHSAFPLFYLSAKTEALNYRGLSYAKLAEFDKAFLDRDMPGLVEHHCSIGERGGFIVNVASLAGKVP